ncbi:ArnT family glycosyltransferase [Pseudonocardia xinjiangensis]|uniref:Glycosyltransferase family 39 protein n=1 Tax=Pseudonocardia xinjiangensis TaxID=75289 RepID=A0ABX1R6M6_9PSEU|nr:glycosyltransferase family 39 protein [Pseudonocardia xinjiangensis]NMH75534.1 glycosyltransferase family 39 protein [Pseudonocardia xinjiangensis]
MLSAQLPRTRPPAPPSTTGREPIGRAALSVVAVVTLLSVVRAFGPLTYPGDIWRQSDTATIARNFATGGMQLFYPQINWGGAGPGYVETEFPLMPWLSAALYEVFGEHAWLGRLVSLVFMLVATAAFWGLARRLLPVRVARWALVAFAVSPAFMRYGTAFMPEATVLACYLLALLAFCRWLQEDRRIWLVAAAAATSAAALVKPTSLHIGVVLGIWLALAAPSRLRRPSLYLAGVAALVAPALWLWHGARLHAEYGNTFGVLSGGDSKWGSLALWFSPAFYLGNLKTETIFVYGLVGVPLAVLGVVWLWRRRSAGTPTGSVFPLVVGGVVALVVYYFAVGRYSSSDLGIQYHIYSLPYAAICTGAGLGAAAEWLRPRLSATVFAVVSGLAVVALGAQSVNVLAESLRSSAGAFGTCADALTQVSAPGQLVVVGTTSRSVENGVPNNYQEPVIFYLADRKGWSLAADQQDPALLAQYRQEGARFYVAPDSDLVPAGGALSQWLGANATQVRSSGSDGCAVWALDHPVTTS